VLTPGSSEFVIARDPFRAIVRGRQLFQRKFTDAQGLGPRKDDGVGDIETDGSLGAGLGDSCAACHSRPFGSAGFGGNVFTRPDSRDAPHLFGLGMVEMLGDEITRELRAIRATAAAQATATGAIARLQLVSKGIDFGWISALPSGRFDTAEVRGVDADLRVRPFFAQGKTMSMREFIVGALNAEMGMQAPDPDLLAASQGQDVITPSGMLLSGSIDAIEAPRAVSVTDDPDNDGVVNEIPPGLVDYMEFYLLNYFKPAVEEQTPQSQAGAATFASIGCTACHVPDLQIAHDRRVADVQTQYDAQNSNGVFNHLFATATPLFSTVDDGSGNPPLEQPLGASFTVQGIYADFRRHDLGPGFYERNFDGTLQRQFMTEPLWGVASSPPYGHDGRSATLNDAILRHGGEAQLARDHYAALSSVDRSNVLAFLGTLVLFAPPDTASNLDVARPNDLRFPLHGHGSIDLSVLFNMPSDKE
jgi:stage V sporulation protein SpoVS